MSNSQQMTKRSLSIWQFILLIAVIYIIGLFVTHKTTVTEKTYWSGFELEKKSDNNRWIVGNRFQVGSEADIQEVRFRVTLNEDEKWQRPIGLMLGGPFSAEVFWDEHKIGDKGIVGRNPQEEIAGPIDFISFIPAELLSPGDHYIRVRLSTQHLLVSDDSVFHHIWLAPYRDSGRRDLRYYAVPLIILSALMLLSFQSLRIGRNAGNTLHIGMGLYGFSIVVLLLSEVSRALVNYPYPYHELRGLVGWLSNISAGLMLIYVCWKTTSGRLPRLVLPIGMLMVALSYWLPMNSGDERLALDFILLVLVPTIVFALRVLKGDISYQSTLPLFWLTCLISNLLSTGLFLDSYQFIGSLVLMGGAWLWVYVDVKPSAQQTPDLRRAKSFVIQTAGEQNLIPVKDCYALKGEGNYTSVMLLDGKSVLHQDGLGAVMETNPQDFVRVHKSYAVNLSAVKALKSAPGSKYWVEIVNGQTIPVSRYRVTELRGLLNEATAPTHSPS